jgi:hypothetical protein
MAPSVKILMNAQTTAMTVIATLPVPIPLDPGRVHAILATLEMALNAQISMSALE